MHSHNTIQHNTTHAHERREGEEESGRERGTEGSEGGIRSKGNARTHNTLTHKAHARSQTDIHR